MGENKTVELALPEDAPSNDGLAVAGDLLYSAENSLDTISVWKLEGKKDVTAEFLGRISSADFDFPATLAIYGDYLCTVNARIDSLPFPDIEGGEGSEEYGENFSMSCVDNRDFD